MNRKIAVVLPVLSSSQRDRIAREAASLGFSTLFFEDTASAIPHLSDVEIILGQDAKLIPNAPSLRWICTPSAGVNPYVDDSLYHSPDVLLSNSSGAYGVTISEHIVMVTLALMRRSSEYREIVAERKWIRNLTIRSIRDSRITLLGTGDIGRKAAARLRAFDPACILGVSRTGKPDPLFDHNYTLDALDSLLPKTDVLIMSLPGTPETTHLMNAERLAMLPRDAYLINVGRGTALDENALEALMRAGHLAGAALDVFETEPLPADSTLWTCPRVFITPHNAGNMTLGYTVDQIVSLFLEDLTRYANNLPLLRQVDRRRGY